jgi:hypothetical protein
LPKGTCKIIAFILCPYGSLHKKRNELVAAQLRLATTLSQIKLIELKNIEDSTLARRKQRENELAHQQLLMKQQKESEFMREIQLNKLRQLSEVIPFLY